MPSSPLKFEFAEPPASGGHQSIAPGITWVRHPLPMALDHINVWLLYDDTHFSIVDTGIQSRTSKQVWNETLSQCVPDHTIDKVVGTHMHPDHIGLAGWLCETHNCPLWMTSKEYLMCRVLCSDTGKPAPPEGINFYKSAGLDQDALDHYQQAFGSFGRFVSPLPQNYVCIADGDLVRIGRHDWQVIIGSGHSPEHACLYNVKSNILISGDQILPSITSIVAVWPTEPDANPLKNWLTSCHHLQDVLPDDVLVLPSHGLPFRGAHARLQALITHHEEKFDELLAFSATPRRVIDVFDVLFKSKIGRGNITMAIGEAVAHYNYLLRERQVERTTDVQGVHWYQRLN